MLQPTSLTGQSSSAQPNTPSPDTAASTSASDFQSFLSLLTAQLRNQDPLSPLDSTQFVEQLASFSTVEQQIETNEKLDSLASSLSNSQLIDAAQWVGKNVETSTSVVAFSGEPITFGIPEGNSDQFGSFVVKNNANEIVHRQSITQGAAQLVWDGNLETGELAANGNYTVAIEYSQDGELTGTSNPLLLSRVTEARLADGHAQLILSNGAPVSPEEILAIHSEIEN